MNIKPRPFFLPGGAGNLFAMYVPAVGTTRGCVLYIPPFAEEMNRCRHIASEQARRLSTLGYACLVLDLYGTGDSAGEFTEASWEIWLKDVKAAADWLQNETGADITLWGFRLGALIAADAANSDPGRFSRLLLWQPVSDGKLFLTQYLRLRVAFLMDNNLPQETTESMRESFRNGEVIEVAGYPLSNPLVADLDAHRISDFNNLSNLEIHWFEHVSEQGKSPSIATKRTTDKLGDAGNHVTIHTFSDPPMWQLHKRDEMPELLTTTTQLFETER